MPQKQLEQALLSRNKPPRDPKLRNRVGSDKEGDRALRLADLVMGIVATEQPPPPALPNPQDDFGRLMTEAGTDPAAPLNWIAQMQEDRNAPTTYIQLPNRKQ